MIQQWLYPFMMNYLLMSISTTVTGTFLTVSSNSVWLGWMGLEMNLLGFILMLFNNNNNETILKYFMTQALGSVMLMSTSLMEVFMSNNFVYLILYDLSLYLKLGIPPLHYWLPLMVENISKFQLLTLLTWQKMGPLFLLTNSNNFFTYLMMMLSLMMGTLGSMNEMRMFTLLTFSSMSHSGWMIISLLVNEVLGYLYLFIYFFMVTSVMLSINNKNKMSIWFMKNYFTYILMLNLLSLGGLPPLTGFLLKWLILTEMSQLLNFVMMSILILTSMVLMYYYLRISMNSFLNNKMYKNIFVKKTNLNNNMFSLVNLVSTLYLL